MSLNVVFTEKIPDSAERLLTQAGISFQMIGADKNTQKRFTDVQALVTLLSDTIDEYVLDRFPDLKIIANYAVGYNNIDLAAAQKRNIIVTNTPDVLTETTADLAFALILSVARRVVEGDQMVRSGKFSGWAPAVLPGFDVFGKTIGLIGMGRIAQAVARRAAGFNMNILYYSRSRNTAIEEQLGAKIRQLDELLRESDFVSLHVPLTPQTRHLIDGSKLALLKRSAFLINTARGPVVDEQALVEALKAGRLAGAGLDVFENEPQLAPGLSELMNVVLLPHIGSDTTETRSKMAEMVAKNIIAVAMGESPPNVVNPDVFGK